MSNKIAVNKNVIRNIEKAAKKYFIGASGCHDWTHTERVRKLALAIGKKEKADLKIIEIVALLHDISRKEEMKKKGIFCHAEKGAKEARKILKKYQLNETMISSIAHCIQTHRYRGGNIPQTLEAKILYDADKMDSIGAIGVARDFLFAGNAGSGNLYTGNEKCLVKLVKNGKDFGFTREDSAILEYEIKLRHIKNKMLTQEGKRIAKDRDEYMQEFFQRFWQEVKGKK